MRPKVLQPATIVAGKQIWTKSSPNAHPELCSNARTIIDDDVTLVRSHYCPSQPLVEQSLKALGEPTIVITLGLAGESAFVEKRGSELLFRAGQTTVSAFSGCAGERRYRENQAVRQLRVVLGKRALSKYFGQQAMQTMADHAGLNRLSVKPIPPWCRHQILTLTQGADNTSLDIQIAALTLIRESLDGLVPVQSPPSKRTKLTANDIEKLEQTVDLMKSQMHHALPNRTLAMSAGLNDFKFKSGFRELHGISPQKKLLELRMKRAWSLLESGIHVGQVARLIGYPHAANFSAAFNRFFGRAPKTVFKMTQQESREWKNGPRVQKVP